MVKFLSQRFDHNLKVGIAIALVLAAGVYFLSFLVRDEPSLLIHRLEKPAPAAALPVDWKVIRQMEIDYWKMIRAETMTPQQIFGYFNWSNHTSCALYQYFGGVFFEWNSAKGIDGQYPVCLDATVRPTSSTPCLAYSFGVRDEWSFEEALERYGCEIFAFDPSMNKGDHDHSSKIHFYKLGLGPKDSNSTAVGWTLKTLDSIYRMLKPRHGEKIIDYLKIDIEWNEWDALKQILATEMFSKVRQLSVEFHLPHQSDEAGSNMAMTLQDNRSLVALVQCIEKKMTRFASRGIPWGDRKIKSFNNYEGNVCFEMSFYQILPY